METAQQSRSVKLNSGYQMPLVCLGTKDSDTIEETVYQAVKLGYRSIDTASLYQNEEKIGRAIKRLTAEGVVRREDLFVISKFWNNEKSDVRKALEGSLKRLQLDYLDLYLVHWPGGVFDADGNYEGVPTHKIWPQLEAFVSEGLVRSIGVSNFNVQSIADLWSYAVVKPAVNQVEMHPYLQQRGLRRCCAKFGIQLMAYSPLCRGGQRDFQGEIINIFKDPVIASLAAKYARNGGQLILNWFLRQGIAVIPRSENPERLSANLSSSDFELTEDDYNQIDSLERNIRMVQSEAKLTLDYFA